LDQLILPANTQPTKSVLSSHSDVKIQPTGLHKSKSELDLGFKNKPTALTKLPQKYANMV
jgi:hypothetical protein